MSVVIMIKTLVLSPIIGLIKNSDYKMNYLTQHKAKSDKLKKGLIIALIGVILTIPLESKVNSILLGVSFFLGLLYFINERKLSTLPNYIYLLPLIFVIRLLWLFGAEDTRVGVKTLDTELPLLIIPLLFSLFSISRAQKNLLILSFICMGFFLACFTLVRFWNYFFINHIDFVEFLNMESSRRQSISSNHILNWRLAHYTFYSALIVYGLNALIYFKSNNIGLRFFIAIYITASVAFIYLTGSLLGIVFLAISLFIFLLQRVSLRKRTGVHLIALFFLITLFVLFISFYKQIDGARYMMATIAVKSISERPLLGHGTGSRHQLMRNTEFEYHYSYSVNHPHNQFLSEMMQFGIVGAIPLLVFLLLGFFKSYFSSDWQVFSILFVVLVLMLFEAPFHSNKAILPLVLMLTLSSKKTTDNDPEN
jgi:O-antigen ligase